MKEGDILTLTNEKVIGTMEKIYVSYPNLAGDVVVGNTIMIDDGKIEVMVDEITPTKDVKVKVKLGGIISSKKGLNLPDTKISLPALTEKDLQDLDFIMKEKLDWVALSFVRRVADIIGIKQILQDNQSTSKVIAKIEMPEALDNLQEIIAASHAVMVARGDLGVEVPIERVPLIQRRIIRECMKRGKPVIVATQMMESMIDKVKPNRSESTDVANAVLEGTDAVMLSGETATGNHPALVVETMRKIIMEAERTEYRYNREEDIRPLPESATYISDAVCLTACRLADSTNANALIGMTQSGYTGFVLSSYRPKSNLFVFTKEKSLVNQLSLSWGVRAFYYDEEEGYDQIIADQIKILKERGFIKKGQVVVNTGSTPVELHLPTNTIKVSVVE